MSEDCDLRLDRILDRFQIEEAYHLSEDCDTSRTPPLPRQSIEEAYHLSEDCDMKGLLFFFHFLLKRLTI